MEGNERRLGWDTCDQSFKHGWDTCGQSFEHGWDTCGQGVRQSAEVQEHGGTVCWYAGSETLSNQFYRFACRVQWCPDRP